MIDEADCNPANMRSVPARIGICLLNLLVPGLGLMRLSRWQANLTALFVALLAIAATLGVFARHDELQASGYLLTMGLLTAVTVLNLSVTVVLSWRWSKGPVSHPHWYSRWYAIVGLWLALQVVLWPVPDWVRSFYHPYYAPSVSMAPSIEQFDRFVAHMRDYDPVRRGDVVIVQARDQDWVKRVAAVPGDRIAMRDGEVILNGEAVPQATIGTELRSVSTEPPERYTRLREQFPGEARPHEIIDSGHQPYDDVAEVTLGPGEYFLLGDNRDNSLDSRHGSVLDGLGVVERKRIKGRVPFRFWRNGFDPAPL